MIRALLAVSVLCLAVTAPAAAEDCYPCHGQKGMKGYVDKQIFKRSVHGALACNNCHMNIKGYPHGRVVRVNCRICHLLGREGAPREQAKEFELSVHGRALAEGNTAVPDCQTCHGSHAILPSSDPRSRTNRRNIPSLCSGCHPEQFRSYAESIHGRQLLEQKNTSAPTCFDCHSEHRVPKTTEKQWKLSLIKECGTCHAEQLNTYRQTYHGKVTELGYTTIAKCSDCHGSHDILPPSDPGSRISRNNIVATCRQCHPGATEGFTKYYPHAEETNRSKYPVLYYTYLFMTVLLVGVFTFFLTHMLLWAFRTLKERIEKRRGG